MFGGRGRSSGARRGADLRYDLMLDFEEAAFGTEKIIVALVPALAQSPAATLRLVARQGRVRSAWHKASLRLPKPVLREGRGNIQTLVVIVGTGQNEQRTQYHGESPVRCR